MSSSTNRTKSIAVSALVLFAAAVSIAFLSQRSQLIDRWRAYLLRSRADSARKQVVELVCRNPSPRAARELARLFAREDEAVTVEVLGAASPRMLSYVLEAVQNDAAWFLDSTPPNVRGEVSRSFYDDNPLVLLRQTTGSGYFVEEAPLERQGEPAPDRLRRLSRSTAVVARILRKKDAYSELESRADMGDPQLLIIFLALSDLALENSQNAVACSLYRTGLRSRSWIVRSVTLDAMSVCSCGTIDPKDIIPSVRDAHRIVRAKALQMLHVTGVGRKLPVELLPEVAAMLRDPVCHTEAVDVLCQLSEVEGLGRTVLDAVGFEYARYLNDVPRELGDPSAEEWRFLKTIVSIASGFDCEVVPSLVDQMSSPSTPAEVALHALASMHCPIPIRAAEYVKRFLGSEVHYLRKQALMLCGDLSEIHEDLTSHLLEAATDEDASIRLSALGALAHARLDEERALQVFGKALTDEMIGCRSLALKELVELGEMARRTLVDHLEALEKKRTAGEERDPEWIEEVQNAIGLLDGKVKPQATSGPG